MPRKPTLKEAKAWSIRVYTLALKKAEKGDWEEAGRLTNVGTKGCAFCQHYGRGQDRIAPLFCPDDQCVVFRLCNWKPRGREAQLNAAQVLSGRRTPSNGIRHFRRTIQQLEALEV